MEQTRGLIRKITKGDFKSGLSYYVGQKLKTPVGEITVVDITMDMAWGEKYGSVRYNLYVATEHYTKVWKTFPEHDVTIEFDLGVEHE